MSPWSLPQAEQPCLSQAVFVVEVVACSKMFMQGRSPVRILTFFAHGRAKCGGRSSSLCGHPSTQQQVSQSGLEDIRGSSSALVALFLSILVCMKLRDKQS